MTPLRFAAFLLVFLLAWAAWMVLGKSVYSRTQSLEKRLAKIMGWFCAAMQIAAVLVMLARAIGGLGVGSGNHVGGDIRDAYWLALAGVLTSLIILLSSRKLGVTLITVLASSVCLAILIFVFDYYNVIVEHDTWCGRRMPLPWTH